jgi:hypothetical protein
LAFAVVLSNQLLQAAGLKSSIKIWTDIKSRFLVWYEHNQLVQKYFVMPISELLSKPNTSSANSGITVGKPNDSNSKMNVVDIQHENSYKKGTSPPIALKPTAAQN